MLNILISLLSILITLFLVIGVHEAGHFLAARLLKIKVLRFSIGFGKKLWSWCDKKGTEYVLAILPLGGYVKMLDENEGEVATHELQFAFNRQPFYKKFIVVAAGPFANLLLAFVLYWLLFVVGFTSLAPITGKIIPHSIAADAGVQPLHEIISIDRQPTPSWISVIIRLLSYTGETAQLPIELKSISTQKTHLVSLNLVNWHMDNLKPDPLQSLGLQPYEPEIPAVIGKILPDSPASKADLQINDKIISLNDKTVNDWLELVNEVDKQPAKKLILVINRHNQLKKIVVTTGVQRDFFFQKHGILGITPQFTWPENFLHKNQYNPIAAISHAWQSTYNFIYINISIIGKLLTGKISWQSLGGPISIFQSASMALNQGIIPFLSFLAFVSISIGIINIFPIPGLDGGHIVFQLIEAVLGRPLSPKIIDLCYRLGIIIILLLVFQSTINDILRLK